MNSRDFEGQSQVEGFILLTVTNGGLLEIDLEFTG